MNHVFGALLSALLILGMACPAAGQFETDHLIQVVYNENDSEMGVDLGDLSTMDLSAPDVELRGPGTVGLSQFPTISNWADLRVGYFAVNETTFQNWFATTQPDAPEIGPSQLLNFENGALTVWQKYSDNEIALGIAQVSPPTDTGTYDTIMNLNSGAPGAYAGFNRDDKDGESVLGLLSSQGYVDMYLYHFNVTDLDKGPDTNTDWTAIIRIMADGSTILNPSSGQNQAPVANDDGATTSEDTPVDINVIVNDTDADGTIDGSTITIVTDASNGSTFDNGDGTVTYTPNAGFAGTDTFTYTVDDNDGATSNEATVTVQVTAGNQPPVANDDATTTGEDTPVDINVIANDTDADGTIDGSTVTIVTDASNGSTLDNGDGTVTYTPNAGFAGTDTFTYTVNDNDGATSNEATVTVQVTAGNQPPVANDDGATTKEDTSVDINVLANDTDADGTLDPATVTITDQPMNGTVLDNGDGTVTYTPNAGFTGTDTFTYTVEDDLGATSNETTVTITVEQDSDITAPSVNYPSDNGEANAVRPMLSVNNATAQVGAVLTYDFEVYSEPDMSVEVTSITGVAEGDETTAWEVDVDLDEDTSYYWRSRATDGTEFSPWMDLATFFVNVVNEGPSVPNVSQPADNSEVDTLRPLLAVTNATDPDLDPLTYEFEVYEADMTTLKISEVGVAEGDGTTSWQVDEDLEDNTAYWWRARARDDEDVAGAWTAPVTFSVNITNDAPSAPSVVSPEDGSVVDSLTPLLEVENSIDLDQDVLTYYFEIDQVNTFDSASLEQSEEVPEGDGDTTSWQPSQLADNTTYYWRAKAWDGMADSNWVTASFFVDLENDLPVANDDSAITTEDTAVVVDVIANDSDVDGWIEPATVTIATDPGNGTVEEEGDGTVTYTPATGFLGEDTFTYKVKDDDGASSDEATVTVLVNDEPTAPTLHRPADDTVVNVPIPTLSVNNAVDTDPLMYLFEIYSNEDLSSQSLVASATVEEGEDGITSWTVSVTLTRGQTYYWRCLADDSYSTSSWMETARFTLGDLTLVLTLPAQAKEGDGVREGTVSIPEALPEALEVSLESDDPSEITVPSQVTIPVGEISAVFEWTVVDDTDHDGTQTVAVIAFVSGWTMGTADIVVGDNERSGSRGSSGCFISAASTTSSQDPAPRKEFLFLLIGTVLVPLTAAVVVVLAGMKQDAEAQGREFV